MTNALMKKSSDHKMTLTEHKNNRMWKTQTW